MDRTWVRTREWQQQLPALVDGFLAWKAGVRHCPADDVLSWDVMLVDFNGEPCALYPYTVMTSSIERRLGAVTPASVEEYPNESLARQGYLGTSPLRPSVAIVFNTLEAYRQLHHACPRLSIQAQVQALCRLHSVSSFACFDSDLTRFPLGTI